MLAMIDDDTADFLDGQVTASEAAKLCGVTTQAISNWVRRGHLPLAGIDAQGRRTYRRLDLEKANHATMQRMRKQKR